MRPLSASPTFLALALLGGTCGLTLTVIGALESRLVQSLQLDHGLIGLTQALFFIGNLIGSLAGARMLGGHWQSRRVASGALVLMALGSMAACIPAFAALALGRFVTGVGLATTVVAFSARVVADAPQGGGRLLNAFHGCLAGGAALALALSSPLAGWAGGATAPLALPGALALLLLPMQRRLRPHQGASVDAGPGGGRGTKLLCSWRFNLVLLAMAAYMVLEQAVSMFAPALLEHARGTSGDLAGFTVGLTWIGVGAGRLIYSGSAAARRVNQPATVVAGTFLGATLICSALLLNPGGVGIVLFLGGGVLLGPVIPLCFAMAGQLSVSEAGSAMGVANAAACLGGAAGPMLAGFMADHHGLQAGMLAAAAVAALGTLPLSLNARGG